MIVYDVTIIGENKKEYNLFTALEEEVKALLVESMALPEVEILLNKFFMNEEQFLIELENRLENENQLEMKL